MNELLKYFKGDELAANAWKSKYKDGDEVTPDDMHKRLSKEFARKLSIPDPTNKQFEELSEGGKQILIPFAKLHSSYEQRIYSLLKDFKYIVPQGSIMAILGTDKIGSLSNCFVIGQPHDSYGGIMQKDEQMAQLMKRRGGVGIDISSLRPAGAGVNNVAGTSTGAVSFMERYSNTCREVAQNGRRGALMISIDCRHPDVLEFIKIKQNLSKVTGANVSVQFRDDFMEAVKNDEDYILRFPCDINYKLSIPTASHNDLYQNSEGHYFKKVKAKEVWNEFIKCAHNTAEPGAMFLDAHNDRSPDGVYKQYRGVTTNPCGEIFMQEYDACRLLCLNLFSFIKDAFTEDAKVDYDLLYQMAYMQQVLADVIVDLELEYIDRIIDKIKSGTSSLSVKMLELLLWKNIKGVCATGRRTGCGITALGDCLAALGIEYGCSMALDIIEQIFKTKLRAELDASIDLAILKGTFEGWDIDKEYLHGVNAGYRNPFYRMLAVEFEDQVARMKVHGRRNVSWSTCAPTGTVSLLTQTTSGIEPLFKPYYIRRKKINPDTNPDVKVDYTDDRGDKWQEFPVLHPKFKEWLEDQTTIPLDTISKKELNRLFKHSPWSNSRAEDIPVENRLLVQSIIQKYTSHSISSTLNLPNDVSIETVDKIYMDSWKLGLKGVTIYRDGCRSGVLVSLDDKSDGKFKTNDAPKRPKTLDGRIYLTRVKGKKYYVVIGLFNNLPYEVFVLDNSAIISNAMLNNIIQITKIKRGRYDICTSNPDNCIFNITEKLGYDEETITRLASIGLRHGANIKYIVGQLNKTKGDMTSFGKAIARILKKYIKEGDKVTGETCSNCESDSLIYEEGCVKCKSCGYSKC